MRTFTLRCEMLSRRSLEETFRVFENPENLAAITPAWLNFQVTSRTPIEMRAGVRINYRISWLGLPMQWQTRILEYERPVRFVDAQEKGPYALWRHTHTFLRTAEGTLVRDHVDYAMPFGALGRLAHELTVKKQLLQIFDYRQRELRKMLGGDTVRTLEPIITDRAA